MSADVEEVPMVVESMTGAAIDAARITTSTAALLVSMDKTLTDSERAALIDHLEEALTWLHAARQIMPAANPTSLHVVRGQTPGGLIITG